MNSISGPWWSFKVPQHFVGAPDMTDVSVWNVWNGEESGINSKADSP